jgi:3-oxoacyl-[acyl-carrier-protein] synthase-1
MIGYLPAMGVICALGQGHAAVRAALMAGSIAGMRPQSTWLHDASSYFGTVTLPLPEIDPGLPAYHHSRNNRLLLAAALDIAAPIQEAIDRYGPHRIGVVLGTSTSGILESEQEIATHACSGALPPSYDYRRQMLAAPATFLAQWLGLGGPAYVVSTACTSGAKALASARRMLQSDLCDVVLCGGVDTLCRLTANGFASLEAMAAQRCNPFSINRAGINLGEGAALFLMTREPSAVALLGSGASSDAHHMSAPDPSGQGAERAMRAALADAGLHAGHIGYVNLHGTATPHNDAMESLAVSSVFGLDTLCSSTKPLTGHALGAAGALEAAFCWLTLVGNPVSAVPPHVWDGQRDPSLPRLNLASCGQQLPAGRTRIVSNSFAFGGNNASLVLGQTDG